MKTSTAVTLKRWFRFFAWTFFAVFVLINTLTAVHAYKFTHFYDSLPATPANPSSWDKIRPLLTGIDAAKKPNRTEPGFAYKDISVSTADGEKLSCWMSVRDSAAPFVILFHGHGSNKAALINEATVIHELGMNVFMADMRAHGSSSGNTCTIGYKEINDVAATYDYVHSRFSGPIVLYGISMGAATVLHAVARKGLRPDGLILEMPFGSLQEAVAGRLKMMGVPEEPMGSLLTFWGGLQRGFWAFGFKPYEDARSVHCSVLLQWGANDRRVQRSEVQRIYDNIPVENKELVIYPSAAHESLVKNDPEKWKKTVSAFLQKNVR